jgi:hypothetical protein
MSPNSASDTGKAFCVHVSPASVLTKTPFAHVAATRTEASEVVSMARHACVPALDWTNQFAPAFVDIHKLWTSVPATRTFPLLDMIAPDQNCCAELDAHVHP